MATGSQFVLAAKKQQDAVIIDEGFLIQRIGINPHTGEAWKPCWVVKHDCPAGLLAEWNEKRKRSSSANIQQEVNDAPTLSIIFGGKTPRKRSSSVNVKEEQESLDIKLKEDGASDRKRQKVEHDVSPVSPVSPVPQAPMAVPLEDVQTLSSSSTPPSHALQANVHRGRSRSATLFIPVQNRRRRESIVALPELSDPHFEETPAGERAPGSVFVLDTMWLLLPGISSKRGMLVVVQGTLGDEQNRGWFNGELEGARGIVLAVYDYSGRGSIASLARVKMLHPRDESEAVLSVPVIYVWPVEPDEPGQNALVLHGDYRGEVGKVREEDAHGWFISVQNRHFTITAEWLVRVLSLDDDDNILH